VGTSPSRAAGQPAPAAQLGVSGALAGTATASSAEAGRPASNGIDGDAGTDWCTDSWTGSLAVDLGQVRRLDGLGITLDASSPSATASFALATQGGQWQAIPVARLVALDPGEPMYVPLPDQGA